LASLSTLLGESILKGRIEMTHPMFMDDYEKAIRQPINVPCHRISGMKTPEDNYGAFIGMAPGAPY
jgi:hypothetical protein